MVPIRQLTDPNSPFARILNNQLLKMPERDLQAIETGLTGTKNHGSIDDQDTMMADMPSADDPQDSSSLATTYGRATVMPDDESDGMSNRER